MTLTLLWQEYRTAHPDGYGYTWFCERFAAYQRRRHAAATDLTDLAARPLLATVSMQCPADAGERCNSTFTEISCWRLSAVSATHY